MSRRVTSFTDARKNPVASSKKVFNDWKKHGSAVIWLHTKSGITHRLNHLIPYAGIDKNTDKPIVRYLNWTCHESSEDYFARNDPKHCPIELLMVLLEQDGRIEDDEIVFSVDIGNSNKNRRFTKGDFCQIKDSSDWRNSLKPRSQYVYGIIPAENVKAGLMIDIEPQTLGDAIIKLCNDMIESEGDAGNIELNPFAIKYTYDPHASKPSDYYDAIPFRKQELTNEVNDLLNNPPITITRFIDPGNPDDLKKILNNHFNKDVLKRMQITLDDVFKYTINSFDDENNETYQDNSNEESYEYSYNNEENEENEEEEEENLNNTDNDEKDNEKNNEDDNYNDKFSNKCETCEGHGFLGKKRNVECPDCGGSGINKEEEKIEEDNEVCDICDGKGKFGKRKIQCPQCNGTGKMPSDEKSESTKTNVSKENTKNNTNNINEAMARCPSCRKLVPESATECKHCGADFADDDEDEEED